MAIKNGVLLSIFPGIDLFGRAFEEQGYTVVRGPDPLWGGDIFNFHIPAGVFEGIIGGPPCKGDSRLAFLNGNPGENLKPEFDRIVEEGVPDWWVMEAVVEFPAPYVLKLSPRWLGERQSRKRYFHSNLELERYIEVALFEHPEFKHAVRAANRASGLGTVKKGMASYRFPDMCELQGLPRDFKLEGFTMELKYEVVGNAVPMSMGRQVARAVREATNG